MGLFFAYNALVSFGASQQRNKIRSSEAHGMVFSGKAVAQASNRSLTTDGVNPVPHPNLGGLICSVCQVLIDLSLAFSFYELNDTRYGTNTNKTWVTLNG